MKRRILTALIVFVGLSGLAEETAKRDLSSILVFRLGQDKNTVLSKYSAEAINSFKVGRYDLRPIEGIECYKIQNAYYHNIGKKLFNPIVESVELVFYRGKLGIAKVHYSGDEVMANVNAFVKLLVEKYGKPIRSETVYPEQDAETEALSAAFGMTTATRVLLTQWADTKYEVVLQCAEEDTQLFYAPSQKEYTCSVMIAEKKIMQLPLNRSKKKLEGAL